MPQDKDLLDTENNNEENLDSNLIHPDYDFLHDNNDGNTFNKDFQNNEDKFDSAFNNSSKEIQDYIISNKFEENIRLICKIEKLEQEKEQIIVENIAVSILVGLLPINLAKNTLIESFADSGIKLEPFTAGLILKNIDTYILAEARKIILENRKKVPEVNNVLEVRHLTLKEESEEKEKEELRKILLERTGNITSKGSAFIEYKKREDLVSENGKDNSQDKADAKEETEQVEKNNRDSLLAKIHLQNISDVDKMRERMSQIRIEEEERLAKIEALAKAKEEARKKREEMNRKMREEADKENIQLELEKEQEKENENFSKDLANSLRQKIKTEEDKDLDLNNLRQERGEKEIGVDRQTSYSKSISEFSDKNNVNSDTEPKDTSNRDQFFDPYRESF